MSDQPKQLKKSDFLKAVTELAPEKGDVITKAQLIDHLAEYEFLSSWLGFLIEHFQAQGKIEVEETLDGTNIKRATGGGGSAGPLMAYKAVEELNEETGEMEVKVISKELKGEKMDKDDGWAGSHNRAVKVRISQAFQEYKAVSDRFKPLLESTDKDK